MGCACADAGDHADGGGITAGGGVTGSEEAHGDSAVCSLVSSSGPRVGWVKALALRVAAAEMRSAREQGHQNERIADQNRDGPDQGH